MHLKIFKRHQKTYLANAYFNTTTTQLIQCRLMFEVLEWVLYYRNSWNEVELQLFEKLTTEPLKGERK